MVVEDDVAVDDGFADVVYNAEDPVFILFLEGIGDDDGDILVAELEVEVVIFKELNDEF